MARYKSQLVSGAALSSGTAFAWLGYSSSVGFRLRRVIIGVIAGGSAVSVQQLQVGVNPTHAGTPATPTNAVSFPMNSVFAANSNNLISAWVTAPTLNAADEITLAFNSQSGGDFPWEVPEDLFPPYAPAANVGFALVNRTNAMPSGASYALTVEYEELQASGNPAGVSDAAPLPCPPQPPRAPPPGPAAAARTRPAPGTPPPPDPAGRAPQARAPARIPRRGPVRTRSVRAAADPPSPHRPVPAAPHPAPPPGASLPHCTVRHPVLCR